MIDKIVLDEELENNDVQPELTNDEKLVTLLECIGLEEGHDFCYDDGEILLPDDVEVDDIDMDSNKIKNISQKWPGVTIEAIGKSLIAKYVDHEDNTQSCVLPLSVYQLMMFHS